MHAKGRRQLSNGVWLVLMYDSRTNAFEEIRRLAREVGEAILKEYEKSEMVTDYVGGW